MLRNLPPLEHNSGNTLVNDFLILSQTPLTLAAILGIKELLPTSFRAHLHLYLYREEAEFSSSYVMTCVSQRMSLRDVGAPLRCTLVDSWCSIQSWLKRLPLLKIVLVLRSSSGSSVMMQFYWFGWFARIKKINVGEMNLISDLIGQRVWFSRSFAKEERE